MRTDRLGRLGMHFPMRDKVEHSATPMERAELEALRLLALGVAARALEHDAHAPPNAVVALGTDLDPERPEVRIVGFVLDRRVRGGVVLVIGNCRSRVRRTVVCGTGLGRLLRKVASGRGRIDVRTQVRNP